MIMSCNNDSIPPIAKLNSNLNVMYRTIKIAPIPSEQIADFFKSSPILTILGYSINDTIVIYDRIRENLKRRHNKNWTLEDCMDESVNQTAIRSLNTSITTLFSVIALLIFGGASLKTFIMTLLIGILAGTYSSIFIATPIVYILNKRKGNNMEDMFKNDDDENNNGKRVEKILV